MNKAQGNQYSFQIIPDIQYTTAAGIPLYLDCIQPDPLPKTRMPVVIYIHGGGWTRGNRKGERNKFLATHGFFTISIDYRLSQQAIYPAQIEDVKAAVRWVRANAENYQVHPEQIGVWGHSAGAHLASLLGTTGQLTEIAGKSIPQEVSSSVQAVVAMAGPSDFTRMGGWHEHPDSLEAQLLGGAIQERVELTRLANPITYIHPDTPPFLLFHGTRDTTVPLNQSELLYEALKRADQDVTFFRMADEDHNLTAKGEESLNFISEKTLAFFVTHLKK